MSVFLKSYTKALKRYDSDLYADKTLDGLTCVFRKTKRYEPVCVTEKFKLLNLIECKQFVFALTDNWQATGIPRDWGIDHVLNRVKESDALANERWLEEIDAHNERIDKSKRRELKNDMESFWSHERNRFVKTMDESLGLTHSMSKDEPRKRKKDRSIKNG